MYVNPKKGLVILLELLNPKTQPVLYKLIQRLCFLTVLKSQNRFVYNQWDSMFRLRPVVSKKQNVLVIELNPDPELNISADSLLYLTSYGNLLFEYQGVQELHVPWCILVHPFVSVSPPSSSVLPFRTGSPKEYKRVPFRFVPSASSNPNLLTLLQPHETR